jgi:DNA repair protein RecO (recombination protein O)
MQNSTFCIFEEKQMIEKTRAIVLHQLKYSDAGIVVQVYSRQFGRLSFLIKGMRNKKGGKHNASFQPLSIIDIVFYHKESRGMQMLKEYSMAYSTTGINGNIQKCCIAIFLGEVLNSVLKEESPQEELFDYINDSIIYLNKCTEGVMNFHIAFLTGLTAYLGFEPGKKLNPEDSFFDMLNGEFVKLPPLHGNYASSEISVIFSQFFISKWDSLATIPLTGSLRNEALETLLRYYSLHLPGLKKINSLEILKEVFH